MMGVKTEKLIAQVDDEGRLILPSEVASRYGLKPGAQLRIDEEAHGLYLRRPVTHLAKVYIEPTNECNLECRTCIRNVLDEPRGKMSSATFARIVEGLRTFSPVPTVFFGGFGEPLAHPDIVDMVAQAKAAGAPVQLITNGTLLTRDMSRSLIEAGLDMLWVSLDGATPERYADVRLGADLPEVLANLVNFRKARCAGYLYSMFIDYHLKPHIGVMFVAMKRNIADLPGVVRLGRQFGAIRFMVSNVLPYTAEMCKEVLYSCALTDMRYMTSIFRLELPKIDVNEITREAFYYIMRGGHSVSFAGGNLGEIHDHCPFIRSCSTAISWEGNLSPCIPLLRSHVSFLNNRERFSRRYVVGNVTEHTLNDLWNSLEYVSFRERVEIFDFSPCTYCGGCDLSEANEEDCFGSAFPTCGGCLWAQGVIQCP